MINPKRAAMAGLAVSLLMLGLASVLLHGGVAADGMAPPAHSYDGELPPVAGSDASSPGSDNAGSFEQVGLEMISTKDGDGGWQSHSLSEGTLLESLPGRFWDEAPKSPSVAIAELNGHQVISVSPGPEDMVNVVLELEKAQVGFLMAGLAESPSEDEGTTSAIAWEYHDHLVKSHATLVASAEQADLQFKPARYYSYSFNGIAGSVRAGDLYSLRYMPTVKKVHCDYQEHVNLGESVPPSWPHRYGTWRTRKAKRSPGKR